MRKQSPTGPSTEAGPPPAERAEITDRTGLPVREGEAAWTADEVDELHRELESEVERLQESVARSEAALAELMRDSGDGAGDDQADAGAKIFDREHEMALANNYRDLLEQSQRALGALADGNYGSCENCGEPIGKLRLQAFPRATLCVTCKQKQERR